MPAYSVTISDWDDEPMAPLSAPWDCWLSLGGRLRPASWKRLRDSMCHLCILFTLPLDFLREVRAEMGLHGGGGCGLALARSGGRLEVRT